jgi:predicted transcriptional regulator
MSKPKSKPSTNADTFAPLIDEERKALVREVKKGRAPAALIADAFGVSRNTVKYHAKKAGVTLPDGTKMSIEDRDTIRAKLVDARP